jgi:hypothetical protein
MVLLPDNSGAPETEFIPWIVKRIWFELFQVI